MADSNTIKIKLDSPVERQRGVDYIAKKLGTNYNTCDRWNAGMVEVVYALGYKADDDTKAVGRYEVLTKNTKDTKADPNFKNLADEWTITVSGGEPISKETEAEIRKELAGLS